MTSRPRTVALLLACSALLALGSVVAWSAWQDRTRREQPDAAFAGLTGRALPRGVHASRYRRAIHDNFFRKRHYWILDGEASPLREFLRGTGFVRSDDDAKWIAATATEALNTPISEKDVLEAYEWERPNDSWFLLLKGGTRAVYVQ